MGFPLCNHEQDLGVFGKQHTLKLASSCHWRAAMILPTDKQELIRFPRFLPNPTCSPAHLLSFVIRWKDLCLRVRDGLAACL